MGRLDDVDLSLKLSRKEQDRAAGRCAARASPSCACAGRAHRRRRGSGRRCACSSRAGTPAARAAPSSAWSRRSTPRHVRVSSPRRADARREAPPLPASLRPRAARAGAAWPSLDRTWYGRVLVERVEGFATEEQWQPRLRRDRRLRAHARRRRHDHRQVLAAHLRRRAARALRAPRDDPLKSWKLTDEDWRNREKRAGVRGGHRGDVRRAPTPSGRRGASSPGDSKRCARVQVMRRGHRRDRGGLRAPRVRAARAAGARSPTRPCAPTSAQRRRAKRPPRVARRASMSTSSAAHTPRATVSALQHERQEDDGRDDHRARRGSACRRRR